MTDLVLPGGQGPLTGRVRVPGDKSISHRALLLAGLAEGTSKLSNLSDGLDVTRTRAAIAASGAVVSGDLGFGGAVTVIGGRSRLKEPEAVVNVGNSGTAIRLLAGWCAGFPWLTVLEGDCSIARRPMRRVVEPLRAMGARIDGRHHGSLPPLAVRGGHLAGVDYRPPVASAQVKSAVLLAGLSASGETTVREEVATRAHTEELLALCGADIEVHGPAGGERTVTVRAGDLLPVELAVPADPSQAAFWVVAACVIPGSDIVVEDVYVGPARDGFLDVLTRMGADVTLERPDQRRHTADIHARYAPLTGTDVGGKEVPGLIDEIPVLAVAAARASGITTFADAGELRVKESDRVATTVAALTALGVGAEPRADGLTVTGREGRAVAGGRVDSAGDHRVAMAAAIAGIDAGGPTVVAGWESVATSYPGFEEDLRRCVS